MTTATNIATILQTVNGATIMSIDTRTIPKVRKTLDNPDGPNPPNPHFGRVEKLQTGSSVMVFQNKTINGYESMVNRRLIAEGKNPGSFKVGPRKWGSRIPNLPLVEHNDEFYLEIIFLKPGEVQYLLDGQPVNRNEIQGLTEPAEPTGQGGLTDNQVKIRTLKMSSIQAIRVNHNTYTNFYCKLD